MCLILHEKIDKMTKSVSPKFGSNFDNQIYL